MVEAYFEASSHPFMKALRITTNKILKSNVRLHPECEALRPILQNNIVYISGIFKISVY
jgi:hypothetical protein